jgi:hypothetical protein
MTSSPYLYFAGDRLSAAELTAACIDGHLVELGEGYIPADAVETAALRARSIAPIVGPALAATHLSAAWIHGGPPDPPPRHSIQRIAAQRLHHLIGRRFSYREGRIDEADLDLVGGVAVTSPTRTLVDLARVGDGPHLRGARLLVDAGIATCEDGLAWLAASPALPYKRRAEASLRAWMTQQAVRTT